VLATIHSEGAVCATIRLETSIVAPSTEVWAAIRDVGAVSTRLAPGFIAETRLEGDVRTVTFAGGTVVREKIVSIDDTLHRLGYSALDGLPTFHFASIEVVADGRGCRLVWTADVLPDSAEARIRALMEQGLAVMKKTLEAHAAETHPRAGR
jgi:hypothetical protein